LGKVLIIAHIVEKYYTNSQLKAYPPIKNMSPCHAKNNYKTLYDLCMAYIRLMYDFSTA